MKRDYTTGEVAKIAGVASRTVSKWMERGHLKGYRLPGSEDRRFKREDLIEFLRRNGMSYDALLAPTLKLLLVSLDDELANLIALGLPQDYSALFRTAETAFTAGTMVHEFRPNCVLVDFRIGETEAMQICQNLRRGEHNANVVLLAIVKEGSNPANLDRTSVNEVFHMPFDPRLLIARLRSYGVANVPAAIEA